VVLNKISVQASPFFDLFLVVWGSIFNPLHNRIHELLLCLPPFFFRLVPSDCVVPPLPTFPLDRTFADWSVHNEIREILGYISQPSPRWFFFPERFSLNTMRFFPEASKVSRYQQVPLSASLFSNSSSWSYNLAPPGFVPGIPLCVKLITEKILLFHPYLFLLSLLPVLSFPLLSANLVAHIPSFLFFVMG